jgi:hypothetical protein
VNILDDAGPTLASNQLLVREQPRDLLHAPRTVGVGRRHDPRIDHAVDVAVAPNSNCSSLLWLASLFEI